MQKKNKKYKTRQERGLGKYDAPLSLQFNQGFSAFKRRKLINPFSDKTSSHENGNEVLILLTMCN